MTAARRPTLFVGTYTSSLPHVDGRAEGILATRVSAGRLAPARHAATATDPSYLAATADGRHVYAVDESGGRLVAFARRGEALTRIGAVGSGGDGPCHLALSPDERFVAVAHYVSGSIVVHARHRDGTLGAVVAAVRHSGTPGPAARQDAPHAHMACFDPVTGHLLVTDLGLDLVLVYRCGREGTLDEIARVPAPPGSGPRHLQFHPSGRFVYLLGELDSTLTTLERRGTGFEIVGTTATVPDDARPGNLPAAVRVNADGTAVFVSNRGHDSVARLPIDPVTGVTALKGVVAAGAQAPRDLTLTPDGRHLVVAGQDSDALVLFELDGTQLRRTSSVPCATPASLLFA